jgi:hypothetical protein
MRPSANSDVRMLCKMAMKAMEVIPALPSLTCALDVVYRRLVSLCKPCWEINKHQTSFTIDQWPGEKLDGTLRVLWYHRGEAQLQACFTARDERGLHGLRDAGQRSDLRDAHRRAALLKGQTCIININRLWTLPPQVVEHIVARGPTELVPSGTSQGFKAVLLNGWRQQDIQRLAAWKVRRRPVPAYDYPEIRLSPLLSLAEAVFALGLCLAQEGILDDAMGRHLLVTGRFGVPDMLISQVWKALKLHFAYPQYPLGLRAYIKRVVSDLSTPSTESRFWDEEGNAYLPISQVAKALGKHKTTIYCWIEDGMLRTEDGTPVVKEFSYQTRSGVQKLVQAVARSAIARYKNQEDFEERVIQWIRDSHQIQHASAEREYRRLLEQLEKHLGRKPEQRDIEDKLLDDQNVVRYLRTRPKHHAKRIESLVLSEDAMSLDATIEAWEERLAEALLGSDQWCEALDALQELRQLQQGAHP